MTQTFTDFCAQIRAETDARIVKFRAADFNRIAILKRGGVETSNRNETQARWRKETRGRK